MYYAAFLLFFFFCCRRRVWRWNFPAWKHWSRQVQRKDQLRYRPIPQHWCCDQPGHHHRQRNRCFFWWVGPSGLGFNCYCHFRPAIQVKGSIFFDCNTNVSLKFNFGHQTIVSDQSSFLLPFSYFSGTPSDTECMFAVQNLAVSGSASASCFCLQTRSWKKKTPTQLSIWITRKLDWS